MVYEKTRENFIQWRFKQAVFGLSFSDPASATRFHEMITKIVEELKGEFSF